MPKHITIDDFSSFPHSFMSNEGGTSRGIYRSLNCGPGSRDDVANVAENRRIVAEHIAKRRDAHVLSCYQHHSADVVVASSDWGEDRPKADAMVTRTPGLILGILTADCTPVLFSDEQAGIIGAAHAGWKGALGGVLENTILEMEKLGATRANIKTAIGPTIHQPSYEVGAGFKDQFLEKNTSFEKFFIAGKDSDHFQFDLPGLVTARLQAANILAIHNVRIDTYTSDVHFSYRRTTHRGEPDYGRQISAIMLPA
ncbi:peptidoglycan editing factor PgeF [Kordiimonas sp. SCSIO 12603]|uniref:peptidoglycan editing factor PgeF n=1 Tax=Kordiimonas sp. SCSIO 12603 TaxID=2829596 RepID=UPI002104A180|nr:peptidoglycan editing factor PgeF [Kordiimonas sp. SCSIO 12603]UTW60114.1 peptidoglycan editing factor PgeF [Kordiimonas sp. SCSIO 12603]